MTERDLERDAIRPIGAIVPPDRLLKFPPQPKSSRESRHRKGFNRGRTGHRPRPKAHQICRRLLFSRSPEIGCLIWGTLSLCFLVVGLIEHFPLWSLAVVLGGPLLLLVMVSRMPLADVPIVFVVLASLGGIGWQYAAADYPPWTVGLVFVAYLFSYEEALSGLVKLRYLESIAGLLFDDHRRQRRDEEHLVAKRRIWGYLLATGSSAVVVSGFDSGGQYHLALLLLLLGTFLVRSQLFGSILSAFATTRFLGTAISQRRRWPHVLLALANMVAYGLSLHWLVVHGSAFGTHISTPWSGPAGADADWFGDLETVATVTMLWTVAALRPEWTS